MKSGKYHLTLILYPTFLIQNEYPQNIIFLLSHHVAGYEFSSSDPTAALYDVADQTQLVNDNFKLARKEEEEEGSEQLNLAAAANSSIREMPKRHDSGRTGVRPPRE